MWCTSLHAAVKHLYVIDIMIMVQNNTFITHSVKTTKVHISFQITAAILRGRSYFKTDK